MIRARCRSVARILVLTLFVCGSLLTFPSGVPAMIAVWLVLYTVCAVRSGRSWLPLVGWIAIIAVKNLYWTPGLIALALTSVSAGLLPQAGRIWFARNLPHAEGVSPPRQDRRRVAIPIVVWLVWSGMAWDWFQGTSSGHELIVDSSRPVVCLGDSLTSGVDPDGGYVAELRSLISIPAVDLSQPGISTMDAIKQLPDMEQARPQIVVVELGGHDFLRGKTRAETKANLERIVDAAEGAGARAVLFEIPRGFIFDPYHGVERQIARERGLDLIADTAIRWLVLWSPDAPPGMWMSQGHLSEDGLHPNSLGNRLLAESVANVINGSMHHAK